MSYWSSDDQEEVIVLTTKKPTPRWLRILLKILAVLLALGMVVAGVIAWRYYAVHQRLKKDLTMMIQEEERIRSLGGINAVPDIIDPQAPKSWRFRYLSSVRARKGRPEPEIRVTKVEYDGFDSRVTLLADGVRQYRHYRLYAGKNWRRAPFIARGWGYKQTIENAAGFEIIYWDEDEALAQELANALPDLAAIMQRLGLAPETTRLMIIPQEFGDLVRPAKETRGLVLNSPHVDWIDVPLPGLTPQQTLRAELGKHLMADARGQTPVDSHLPGAARVQNAIDEVLAWQWAVGDAPDASIAAWTATLEGHWISPVTGMPPNLLTQLPPDASDAAARLMMAWLLRKKGPDALLALSAALPQAESWDDVYAQVVGLTAAQVEQLTRQWMQHPQNVQANKTVAGAGPPPKTITLLTTRPDAKGRLLARTPTGLTVLLQAEPTARFTMTDGSGIDLACVAPGTQVRVQGRWLEEGLRLEFSEMIVEQAVLPPALRTPPALPDAELLFWRYHQDKKGRISNLRLERELPGGITSILARPVPSPFPAVLSPRDEALLLVWRQDARCSRAWLSAYDPEQGIVGSWLAPAGVSQIGAVSFIPGDTLTLLFSSPQGEGLRYFRTDAHHVLTPISSQAWHELAKNAVYRYRSYIDEKSQTLQLFDIATQEKSLLYQPGDQEKLLATIPAFGWPPDLHFFTTIQHENPIGVIRVMQISTKSPGEATLLFEASSHGSITSMARCPNGDILYGLSIPTTTDDEGILRLHRSSGEDVAVSPRSEDLLSPIYCANTPAR